MKTFKEFREYYRDLPLLTEEEFQKLLQILKESEDPEEYYEKVKGKLGPLLGKGSSRAAHIGGSMLLDLRDHHPKGTHVDEEGKRYNIVPHKVDVVHKIAIPNTEGLDEFPIREPHQKTLGQLQSIAEQDESLNPHRTYIQHADGTWSHNPKGIIPTVFRKDSKGLHIVSERVDPVEEDDFHKIHGIHIDDMADFLYKRFNNARTGLGSTSSGINIQDHQEFRPHNITNDHQLVQTWTSLIREHGFHPGDFNRDNTGKSRGHPESKDKNFPTKKILLADAGYVQPGKKSKIPNTVEEYEDRRFKKDMLERKKRRMRYT
ncbi:MAG: hypothetical protein EBU90_30745 [Proteobacteria bacterium]|nr:hypothetical protein [Pseudomonadota bacterium]